MNAAAIAEAYQAIRAEAGPDVTVVAATKYVRADEMGILAEAGVEVVGENRVQDMQRKHELHGDSFRWHFIGALQSNKARIVDSLCELVHAVETESTARRLTVPALLEVNLSGEASKSGVEEAEIEGFLERHAGICGLMTMPPFSENPESSRPTFRRLAELARQHGLVRLSMGTSQDWRVGVEEGATLIRVGSTLFRS
ncbi:YggS family pyridoxal phosphate enzyme [Gaiella sp.]|uniref:YggS family pyridoxal phosphate enzyme n=1 Tax=Gaiella sp. TaxID=2663207 RepID=UPI00326495F7